MGIMGVSSITFAGDRLPPGKQISGMDLREIRPQKGLNQLKSCLKCCRGSTENTGCECKHVHFSEESPNVILIGLGPETRQARMSEGKSVFTKNGSPKPLVSCEDGFIKPLCPALRHEYEMELCRLRKEALVEALTDLANVTRKTMSKMFYKRSVVYV